MKFKELKEKLNNENKELLMYFPIPRTGSISLSYFVDRCDQVFTYRNYELDSCFYQPNKTVPPVPKTTDDKNEWELIHFLSEDQSFFINKLSELKTGFCKNIFNHENKKVFTVVRNPIDRLFSIWNYCTNSTEKYQLFSLTESREEYKINDFNEFVKEFSTNGLPEKYPSQMFLKMNDLLDVDLGDKIKIYKIETIDELIDDLKLKYNIKNKYKHFNSSDQTVEKNISDKTLDLIHELYKEDFERFDY